jgi:guanyl-specific ribonuclease Sa
VEKMSKELETMGKKLEELESKPARISQPLSSDVNVDQRAKELLNSISGGEALVYAEKKGITWGNPKSE